MGERERERDGGWEGRREIVRRRGDKVRGKFLSPLCIERERQSEVKEGGERKRELREREREREREVIEGRRKNLN